ncbi:nuclear transport factor 2 family protein [Paracoccus sp. Z118]|uniref:nuclear transport factor 2 family protein n=1 Tax=Paracoccus sp. Z118 TaxID=2851017 RepID=UPI001C2B7B3E|nr:nuclear transport factor 2 family protein [Paracoccus sp. Z118]MBV0891610.1 nuclear transport factor 2 family protein [Paracoccus sp. Z118]
MSMIEERWADEEAWWTMSAAEAWHRTHPSCVMAFASGLLQGEEILAAIDGGPRWDSVVMTDRLMVEGEDCIVLAYRATAKRAEGGDYVALCTSTWVRQADDWQLIQHQQTVPAAG